MSYILVEWAGEGPKQFSVCKKSDIVDGELRSLSSELVGRSVRIQWKRKDYIGKILKLGDAESLEQEADEFASRELEKESTPLKATQKTVHRPSRTRRLNKAKQIKQVLDSRTLLEAEPQTEGLGVPELTTRESLLEGDETRKSDCDTDRSCFNDAPSTAETDDAPVKNYEEKYKLLKVKYKALKRKYKSLAEDVSSEQMLELVDGCGVRMKRADLDRIKLVSSHHTILARNLFRHFFSDEELSAHSLYGKACNANKNVVPLPAIDGQRRDAVIEFILKNANLDSVCCGHNKELLKKRAALKREVAKSLSDFLREKKVR